MTNNLTFTDDFTIWNLIIKGEASPLIYSLDIVLVVAVLVGMIDE